MALLRIKWIKLLVMTTIDNQIETRVNFNNFVS